MAVERSAMEYVVFLLSRRAYSTMELRKKLISKKIYSQPEREQTIAEAVRRGYCNDHDFAENTVRTMTGSGYGPRRIRAKLFLKGIPKELIDEALRESDGPNSNEAAEDPSDQATELLRRRSAQLLREPDAAKRKAKAVRFLAGRGFDANIVFRAYERVFNTPIDDE